MNFLAILAGIMFFLRIFNIVKIPFWVIIVTLLIYPVMYIGMLIALFIYN